MMQHRRVGRTGIGLSVVGLGTAQLQMMPEREAIATLVRGFELGVNWVHTAPDYGGIGPWIQNAIEQAGRDVMVVSSAPAHLAHLEAFFEDTCHVHKTRRLALYGLAGIEDLEWTGENVWGAGGMIEFLQAKKAEGRISAIYASTHASADYVERLVESGIFDALMLAWNPLGFHQQSHRWARAKIGRDYEDLEEYRTRVFPLAARRGVSILAMKPFAGGLLCRSKALPPHDWFADGAPDVDPTSVLRMILEMDGVAAVVPGSASVAEADENARAGHAPLTVAYEARRAVERAAAAMRTTLCSRCGACETTCSRTLAIPSMFRDAYIWTSRNEISMANPSENYFDLHPDPVLACVTCDDQRCACPQGLAIPRALARIHDRMQTLAAAHQHPGPSAGFVAKTMGDGILVQAADVPGTLPAGGTGVARFLVQNVSSRMWLAPQHAQERTPEGIGVFSREARLSIHPLRNSVCPGEVSPLVFEFAAPASPGCHTLEFRLMALDDPSSAAGTAFHTATIAAEPVHGVRHVEHTFPGEARAGVTYGVRLAIENSGTAVWQAHAAVDRVDVQITMDGVLQAVLGLPRPVVAPGEQVTLHFPFRAHDAIGVHEIRVELRRHAASGPVPIGAAWPIPMAVTAVAASESWRLAEISRKHNPWYYNPLTGILESRDGRPFPVFIARGKGARVWDVEGHEFIDYTMGWGSTILGHADDRIQAAVRASLDTGAVLPFPHPVEMTVSRMLLDEFPGNDMVVFGKNGSDVCTIAARLARVITRKRTILSCGFHGWQDFALDYFAFEDCGIPDRPSRTLHKFRFNDRAGFLELFERCRDDLAAVIIEPAGPLISEEDGLGGEPEPQFLSTVAEAARSAGALLVFDEIVTGFRYRQGSVQKATGITPDLTCLGKALASGLPLAALLGPYRIFLEHFHKTHFCPTFRGEVYSLTAAEAAIGIYRREPVADYIWTYGERLRAAIHEACANLGVRGRCTGPPFRMSFVFDETDPLRRRLKRTLFMQELLKNRIITVSGMFLPSTAHDREIFRSSVAGITAALDVVAHAEKRGELEKRVELALL